MNIVFTGKIEETRKEVEAFINSHGHNFQKSVNWQTDLLVVGQRAAHFTDKKSTKEHEAENRGIKIIHVQTLDDMLEYFI